MQNPPKSHQNHIKPSAKSLDISLSSWKTKIFSKTFFEVVQNLPENIKYTVQITMKSTLHKRPTFQCNFHQMCNNIKTCLRPSSYENLHLNLYSIWKIVWKKGKMKMENDKPDWRLLQRSYCQEMFIILFSDHIWLICDPWLE